MDKVDFPRIEAPPVTILGVPFDHVTTSQVLRLIEAMVLSREPHYLVTANVDFLVQALEDVELRRILFEADLVLCDGTPLLWVSRWLGNPLPERVAGSDLAPLLLHLAAEKGYRLFLLGGAEEVGARAVERIRKEYPGIPFLDHYSPPFSPLLEMDHEEIVRRVRAARPDLLLVCFGAPKQEKWMAMHHRSLGVPVSMGAGGTIDFLAGRLRRAPLWMRRSGTEWVFRLAQEPRRLFHRYLKDLRRFAWPLWQQWWRLQFRRRLKRPHQSRTLRQTGSEWQEISLPPWLDLESVQREEPLWESVLRSPAHCLLKLETVEFIDSTGVGLIIRLQKKLHATGRRLVLVQPSPAVTRAFDGMKLSGFFTWAGSVAEARPQLETASEAETRLTPGPFSNEQTLHWRGEVTARSRDAIWEETERYLRRQSTVQPALTIELAEVRFMDSSGLGLMIRAKKLAARLQAPLIFAHPGAAVRNVIQLARLESCLLDSAP